MLSGKTTFEKIAKIVNRKRGHSITSRTDVLREQRSERLKKLGVRPLSESLGVGFEIPHTSRGIYAEAYRALKKSNKPWATEHEIRSILFGNKPMSRERSSEVIEVLRRARVTGFRETDEVTSGDVYSERVLNALDKYAKIKNRAERQEHLEELRSHDQRILSGMNIDAGAPPESSSRHPTTIMQRMTATTDHKNDYLQTTRSEEQQETTSSAPPRLSQAQSNAPTLPQNNNQEKNSSEDEQNQPRDIPLTYGVDDDMF